MWKTNKTEPTPWAQIPQFWDLRRRFRVLGLGVGLGLGLGLGNGGGKWREREGM